MNLALRDIRHQLGRFIFTTVGVGLLLMIVMGMGGIYRGLVDDATFLVDRIGADLWVVQHDTRGPFAEVSRLSDALEYRVRAVPGVTTARRFVSHTIQREYRGVPLRTTVQGLAWPEDQGEWLPLIAGRRITDSHYEWIADRSLGLALGEMLQFGRDRYRALRSSSSPMIIERWTSSIAVWRWKTENYAAPDQDFRASARKMVPVQPRIDG